MPSLLTTAVPFAGPDAMVVVSVVAVGVGGVQADGVAVGWVAEWVAVGVWLWRKDLVR